MPTATQPLTTMPPTTIHVQSLAIRLDGITADDYLTWVRDPEPPALDHGLRSVATTAEPLEELINIQLAWAEHPPTTPSAAATAAGFPLTPEIVAVHGAGCAADRSRATLESRTDAGRFSQRVSRQAIVERASRARRRPVQKQPKEHVTCPSTKHNSARRAG
jgi:hypothetical protein